MGKASFHGLLVLDKPGGMTSRDAVNRAMGWFPKRTKLGHTGTLDPLATGVLVLTVGHATRLAEYVQRMAKTYRTTIRFGAVSDTDDADGEVTPRQVEQPPTRAELEQALANFVGTIEQVPPAISAIKVGGRRSCALVRKGEEVELQARSVTVHRIAVLAYDYPLLELEVHCGKGTYIRSLARDLGARLGCGGYVEILRRTQVGPFRADDGVGLYIDPPEARARLQPLHQAVVEVPQITLGDALLGPMQHGKLLPLDRFPPTLPATGEVAVFSAAGQLALIAEIDDKRRLLRPTKVFVTRG